MRDFYDEEAERAAAQSALRHIAAPHFRTVEVVRYHGYTQYESWDHFAERFVTGLLL